LVLGFSVNQFGDGLTRYDQNVRRRLRVNIVNDHTVLVLVDKVRGNLSPRDLPKNGICHSTLLNQVFRQW
jgi:hypothetical protein